MIWSDYMYEIYADEAVKLWSSNRSSSGLLLQRKSVWNTLGVCRICAKEWCLPFNVVWFNVILLFHFWFEFGFDFGSQQPVKNNHGRLIIHHFKAKRAHNNLSCSLSNTLVFKHNIFILRYLYYSVLFVGYFVYCIFLCVL